MPRIEPLTNESAPASALPVLEALQKQFGKAPNFFRTLAHAPAVLQTYLKMGENLKAGALGPELMERIAVRVAALNGCSYCASAHHAVGKSLGLPAGELAENAEGRSEDARTQTVLTLVDRLVGKNGWLSDGDLAAARAGGLSDGEVLEAVAVTSMNIMTNYINHVAGTEIDFPRVEVPESSRR